MYALIQNNQITQIGELYALFPNEPKPTHQYAIAHGAVEVIEGQREDERFYWVTFDQYVLNNGTVTRQYTNTPKELNDREESDEDGNPLFVQVLGEVDGQPAMVNTTERLVTKGLRSQYITQFKATANSLLSQTDWTVIRKAERGVDVPADVAASRAAILAECDRLIAAVTAAQDMPAFIAAVQSANWG
jgi:hypothetical protein